MAKGGEGGKAVASHRVFINLLCGVVVAGHRGGQAQRMLLGGGGQAQRMLLGGGGQAQRMLLGGGGQAHAEKWVVDASARCWAEEGKRMLLGWRGRAHAGWNKPSACWAEGASARC